VIVPGTKRPTLMNSTITKSLLEDSMTMTEEASQQIIINQMHQKFTAMIPVIKDLYDHWLQEKNNEKLDILEECTVIIQMFEKIGLKDIQSTSRWYFPKPRSKGDTTNPNSNPLPLPKKESAAKLGGGRLKLMDSRRLRSDAVNRTELTSDERERLRIFLSRTKNSRDKLLKEKGDNSRLRETESVDIKVYINDLKYRVITLQSAHSKSDLSQLAIQAFKLNPIYNYTISLWRNFKQNLEIKETGDSSPFKLYFNVVMNESHNIFHIHRIKPAKGTQVKPPQLGPNMEDWKVPSDFSGSSFLSPKRKIPRITFVGFNINSTSKQSPPIISKIKALYLNRTQFPMQRPPKTSANKSSKNSLMAVASFKPVHSIAKSPS